MLCVSYALPEVLEPLLPKPHHEHCQPYESSNLVLQIGRTNQRGGVIDPQGFEGEFVQARRQVAQ